MPFENSAFASESCRAHFLKARIPFTEEAMIGVLERPDNKWDVLQAVVALREIGSEKSIPALKRAIYFPNSDVRCSSVLTIAKIAGSRETEFYSAALADRDYPEKGYALWALKEVGDARGLEAANDYLDEALRRAAKANPNGSFFRTAESGLLYLARFAGTDERLSNLFSKWKKFLPSFRENERERLLSAIPEFRDLPDSAQSEV